LSVVNGILVGLNALYMSLVVVGNVSDFDVNRQFVHHVLAMDTANFGRPEGTGLDSAVMWRALTAASLQTTVYMGIIIWELATAAVLIAALLSWIFERTTCKRKARNLSTIGLLMVVLLFFGGFIDIGGEWFQMWRSTVNNGLEPAFRNATLAIATLVLIHLPLPTSATDDLRNRLKP
jgi:predicted small integral membrane protein